MTLPTAAVVRATFIPGLTGTDEDTNLGTLITRADEVLAGWCGFPAPAQNGSPSFEVTTYTHYLDGPSPTDSRALVLPVRPIKTVTTIKEDRVRDWAYSTTVSSGDYTIDAIEGAVYLHDDSTHGAWGSDKRILEVVYTAGWDTGATPGLTYAIGALVAHWWHNRWMAGVDSVTAGGDTIAAADSFIPEHVQEAVAPFRMWEVGFG